MDDSSLKIGGTGGLRGARLAAACTLVVLLGLAIIGANQWLTLFSVFVLVTLWHSAFRSSYRTVLASFLTIQWLQTSSKAWLGKAIGVSIAEPSITPVLDGRATFRVYESASEAVALGLIAILLVHVGGRLTAVRWQTGGMVTSLTVRQQIWGFIGFAIIDTITGPFVGGGLAQAFIALGQLKYVFVVTLISTIIAGGPEKKKAIIAAGVVVFYEVVTGFLGFFSDFKTVFIYAGISWLALSAGSGRSVRPIIIMAPLLMALVLVWTAIKSDYRQVLNQGTAQQVVLVGLGDRLSTLGDLLGGLDPDDIGESSFRLMTRLAYTDYLGIVLERVPAVTPHESGTLWGEAFYHMAAPRIFFPDKPPLPSDSDRTIRYTGLKMASGDQGTSISMGWVAESYIDFGYGGVLVISLMLGCGIGLIARVLLYTDSFRDPVALLGVIIVTLSVFQQFETSSIKFVPGIAWRLAVGILALSFLFPALFARRRRRARGERRH